MTRIEQDISVLGVPGNTCTVFVAVVAAAGAATGRGLSMFVHAGETKGTGGIVATQSGHSQPVHAALGLGTQGTLMADHTDTTSILL